MDGNQWKLIEISGNSWKWIKLEKEICGNQWKTNGN